MHPAASDCCPADTGISEFLWGVHFWQGAGMKPLLGLPWHHGCYLSPNSCWSSAGWGEWPGISGTGTWPKLDAAGSWEVLMEETEGVIPMRVSVITLSLETALSSILYLNPFGLAINKQSTKEPTAKKDFQLLSIPSGFK